MKDMLYDFVIVVVVIGLISVYVIGKNDSMQSNLDSVAKANTTKITDVLK